MAMALHNVLFGQYDGLVSQLVRLEGKHTAQRAHCALTQNVLLRTEDLRKDGFHQSPKLVFLNIFGGALAFHNFSVDTSPLLCCLCLNIAAQYLYDRSHQN